MFFPYDGQGVARLTIATLGATFDSTAIRTFPFNDSQA